MFMTDWSAGPRARTRRLECLWESLLLCLSRKHPIAPLVAQHAPEVFQGNLRQTAFTSTIGFRGDTAAAAALFQGT
jgi:hypothetical protein